MLTETLEINEGKKHFPTKAEMLCHLSNKLSAAKILPLHFFTVSDWRKDKNHVLSELRKCDWFHQKLVVRSSAIGEDGKKSCAGQYATLLDVEGEKNFIAAVEKVLASFGDAALDHQVLVQPYLCGVIMSGVAFGWDPNTGGPYRVVNYDDKSGNTASVTSGILNHKCYIQHRESPLDIQNIFMAKVISLMGELEKILNTAYLDIEFAVDQKHELYLFQVRRLMRQTNNCVSYESHQKAVERVAERISLTMKPHPYLYGKQTIYGIMPDWNPAEIIGIRPKPLALSIYRELVTDAIWAYQRDNYGYANLRSFPLLVDFEGLPYIDVRVSFNSFLPKELPADISERLVNYYLDRLIDCPSLHDKIEFDVVFSCYTLDLGKRLNVLNDYGFTGNDCRIIHHALVNLTKQIIDNQQGLWKKDLEKIEELSRRQGKLFQSDLDPVSKMYWMLEDCKRYGTLPFAGLARAAFIAVQILKSLIAVDIINEKEYAGFLSSIHSISSEMNGDFRDMPRRNFLKKYGHLRPGTYDILSLRYDEAPDLYFDWENKNVTTGDEKPSFSLSLSQLRQIQENIDRDGLEMDVHDLLAFIRFAIESREYSKFIFSKSVSELLKICAQFSSQFNITREDCAYLDLPSMVSLYRSSVDPEEVLYQSIQTGKRRYQMTASMNLPALITHASQAWAFELPDTLPNFITQKNATGKVVFPDSQKEFPAHAILMIANADPGYDWIFSRQIAGFITQYGGVNSHMAIRAGELGIPAVIGAGEIKFNEWSLAKKLHIDCLNHQVKSL
jgi:phosphohistidine swiveling domain-containing protein